MTLAERVAVVLAQPQQPRREGRYWLTPCPAHQGEKFKCAIWDGDRGGLGLKCWTHGCAYKEIILAIESMIPDLREQFEYGPGRRQVRRPGRDFRGSKGKAGGPLLLHGDSPGLPLVITEGERDALAVISAGEGAYAVATYFKGSGNADKADYSAVRKRDVIVWADNDPTGRKAESIVVDRCRVNGASSVRVIPMQSGWPHAVGAADFPPQVVHEILLTAEEFAYSEETVLSEDLSNPWTQTPIADAIRLLRWMPNALLAVEDPRYGTWQLLVDNGTGVWLRDEGALSKMMIDSAAAWSEEASAGAIAGVLAPETSKRILRHALSLARSGGRSECIASVGAAMHYLRRVGLPPGLTTCQVSDLDAQLQYLGAPNGVIDVDTGQLLAPEHGRRCLITRSVPDDYDQSARHSDVDELLGHLEDEDREYLLGALGYALRGRPSRRIYVLLGKHGTGKSTLLGAVGAALGSARANGYHATLGSSALLLERSVHPNAHTSHLVDLPIARIATTTELAHGSQLNVPLIKRLTGGDEMPVRDIRKTGGLPRPVSATIFVGLNPPEADRLNITDAAFFDRLRILQYPAISEDKKRGIEFQATFQTDKLKRQAILALLVESARKHPSLPVDSPTVREVLESHRQSSIGRVGIWLQDRIKVTGNREDVVINDDLWAAVCAAFSVDPGEERVAGYTRKELFSLLREVVPNLPLAKTWGSRRNRVTGYREVRLFSESELDQETCDADTEPRVPN